MACSTPAATWGVVAFATPQQPNSKTILSANIDRRLQLFRMNIPSVFVGTCLKSRNQFHVKQVFHVELEEVRRIGSHVPAKDSNFNRNQLLLSRMK
jgi:hypothetical protein